MKWSRIVRVWHDDVPVRGTQTLLLRGTTLNVYHGGPASGDSSGGGGTWTWERSVDEQPSEEGGEYFDPILREQNLSDTWKQEIWLQPTGTNVLFAMAGPVSLKTDRDLPKAHYYGTDEVLQMPDPLTQPIHYEVISRA